MKMIYSDGELGGGLAESLAARHSKQFQDPLLFYSEMGWETKHITSDHHYTPIPQRQCSHRSNPHFPQSAHSRLALMQWSNK